MSNLENKTPPLEKAGLENSSVSGKETNEFYPEAKQKANETCQQPKPAPEATIAFLRNAFGDNPVTITAILSDPNNRPKIWPKHSGKTLTRTLKSEEEIKKWVTGATRSAINLYFTANRLEGTHGKKPLKIDIKGAIWLYCDCDPRPGYDVAEEQERILNEIRNHPIPPTVVVFTGGGYQCLWRLAPEVIIASEEDIPAIEDRNIWLGSKFTLADNTQNIDRLLRLPGSVNYPDERKKKKGRVEALAYIVEDLTDWERTYDIEDIPCMQVVSKPKKDSKAQTEKVNLTDIKPKKIESLEELKGYGIPNHTYSVIEKGKDEKHESRSEAVMYVALS